MERVDADSLTPTPLGGWSNRPNESSVPQISSAHWNDSRAVYASARKPSQESHILRKLGNGCILLSTEILNRRFNPYPAKIEEHKTLGPSAHGGQYKYLNRMRSERGPWGPDQARSVN